ncbi:oligoendopeptidase F [Mycoplasmoides pirum]|uniref:oligoendopeptidase F n=1 Tax=Mycoplasmoides pirum TaxID=2122 RepID=UPI000698A905|nr:oligoendopeptidase F [Mycoplasmoides pirum]
MKKKLKKPNSNITNKYDWDLDAILEGSTLEKLHENWKLAFENLIKVYDKSKCFKDIKKFDLYLKASKKLNLLSNRLMNYISNNLNEDITNPKWNEWKQKLTIETSNYSIKLSDVSNAIIKHKKEIQKYLEAPKYKIYQRSFDLIFREEKHILSNEEEKVLTKLSILNGAAEDIFDTLTRSEIKFEDALSSQNKKHKIKTLADVPPLLKSSDRKLRKSAWLSEYNGFYRYKETLAKILYHAYLNFNTNAKIRKHKDYISATAFDDEIPVEFISWIYTEVAKFAPIVKKYNSIIKTAIKNKFNLNKVEPWDTQVPLFNKNTKYSIEDAQKIAIAALSPMGNEYIEMVKKAFNEKWISWLPKQGKQTGAYSIGSAEGLSKYYISMNFDNTLRSVYTIVHELGHSMHTWKLLEKQKIYTDVSIFYAEISSIANEMLLNYYLLNKYKNDSKMKVLILNEMIQNFFATTTRQIMFSNFEYEANEKINNGEEFSSESAFDLYTKMYEKYLGFSKNAVKKLKTSNYKKGLSIIVAVPHFYAGIFYVYKYAIGQVASIIATKRILENKPNALNNFMKFLSSGNSLSPLDTIKLLDIDLTKSNSWKEALDIVSEWIEMLSKELKKTKLIKK